MNESSFDRINNTVFHYMSVLLFLFVRNKGKNQEIVEGYPDFDGLGYSRFCLPLELKKGHSYHDRLKFMSDIDCIKKEYPDSYKNYLSVFEERLSGLLVALNDSPKVPYNVDESRTVIGISNTLRGELEYLTKILTSESAPQEPPKKLERLKPIEKLLIIDYLKIDSLKRFQLGQKPGVYFLSRLLDINPESIKNPLQKLDDYTTDKLTDSQAANIYPTLEKVKLFFDNSELKGISKEIEIRINALKIQLGKD